MLRTLGKLCVCCLILGVQDSVWSCLLDTCPTKANHALFGLMLEWVTEWGHASRGWGKGTRGQMAGASGPSLVP